MERVTLPCVYFLTKSRKIVYIGSTRRLTNRLYEQRSCGVVWDHQWSIKCRSRDEAYALERRFHALARQKDMRIQSGTAGGARFGTRRKSRLVSNTMAAVSWSGSFHPNYW